MGNPGSLRYAAAFASIGLATAAGAQITTDCSTLGSFTNCQTYGQQPNVLIPLYNQLLTPPSGPSIPEMIAAEHARRDAKRAEEARTAAEYAEVQAQYAALDEAKKKDSARVERARQAGQMIAAGKCPDARALVLAAGDLEMAAQVDKLCIPTHR